MSLQAESVLVPQEGNAGSDLLNLAEVKKLLELAEKRDEQEYLVFTIIASLGLTLGEVVGSQHVASAVKIQKFLGAKTKADRDEKGQIVSLLMNSPNGRIVHKGTTYFLSANKTLVNKVLPTRIPGLQAQNLKDGSIIVQGKGGIQRTVELPAWLYNRYRKRLGQRTSGPIFEMTSAIAYKRLQKAGISNTNALRIFYERHQGILPDALAPGFTAEYVVKVIAEENRETVVEAIPGTPTPPREMLEQAYRTLANTLEEDILDRLKKDKSSFFEHVVLDVLVAMNAFPRELASVVGRTGDGGIDGVLNKNELKLDTVYFQAKRWDANVGSRELRDFAGALDQKSTKKGVFVTTSQFTKDAQTFVDSIRTEKTIALVDGKALVRFMIRFGVGIVEDKSYSVKKIDEDYFHRKE